VPVSLVRAAAAESAGLYYYQAMADRQDSSDPNRGLLIASVEELTPEDWRHVAALVESLREQASHELRDRRS
jgi:hypothetical protein